MNIAIENLKTNPNLSYDQKAEIMEAARLNSERTRQLLTHFALNSLKKTKVSQYIKLN